MDKDSFRVTSEADETITVFKDTIDKALFAVAKLRAITKNRVVINNDDVHTAWEILLTESRLGDL